MDTKKLLIGTLAGGVSNFFLGFLIYGVALSGFMTANAGTATGVSRMDDMVWWSLILGNIAWAALLTVIFLKWANISSFGAGLSAGATIGLLMCGGFDLIMYGTSNIMNMNGMIVDALAGTVLNALTGGVIGAMLGMGSKPAAA